MVTQSFNGMIGLGVRSRVAVTGTLMPGGVLEYMVTGSGLGGLPDLRLADTLGDGQRLDTVWRPHVAIQRGAATLFDGELIGWSGIRSASTATTAINFGLAPTLQSAGLPAGLRDSDVVTVTFHSHILSLFAAMAAPPLGRSLVQGDVLGNTGRFTGTLAGALASSDPAAAQVALPSSALITAVYAVNGIVGNTHAALGDVVTYRLQLAMPLSAAHAVQVVAAAPGLAGPVTFDGAGTGVTPPPGHAQWGPSGDYIAVTPAITPSTDASGAAVLRFDFGEVQPTYGLAPHVIDLLVSAPLLATAQNAPLTLNASETERNDFALASASNAAPAPVALDEPVLSVQLGSVYASNDAAIWTGTGGPAGYSPFTGQFGGTFSSAGLAAEPLDDQLSGIDADDEVTFAAAVQGMVDGARAYDIVLRGTLPDGYAVPASGYDLSVTDGAGTPLAYSGDLFATNGMALAPGVSLGGYKDDDGSNVLLVSYTLRSATTLDVGRHIRTASVSILNYATQPGWANRAAILPPAQASTTILTRPASVSAVLLATDNPGTPGAQLAVGETATFRITATLPEGVSHGLDVGAALPPGLMPVSATVVTTGANLTPEHVIPDGHGGIQFGTTTNRPDDRDSIADTIVIDVVALAVAGPAVVQVGAGAAVLAPDGSILAAVSAPVAAFIAAPVPPGLALAAAVVAARVGDAVPFQITLTVPAGTSPDLTVHDTLPTGLDFIPGSAQIVDAGGVVAADGVLALQTAAQSGRELTLGFGAVAASGAAARTVVVGVAARVGAPPGAALVDTATVGTGYATSTPASATVNVFNTVPILAGVAATQAGRDDTALAPLAGLIVTDPDLGQRQTLRITIGDPAHGTIMLHGGGTYDAASGVVTATGTVAEVQAAAAAVRFMPARHAAALGQSTTTTLDVMVQDASGGTATARTVLDVTAVNSAPLLRNAAPCEAAAPGASVHLFTGLLLSDADAGQIETLTLRLADPSVGILSGPGVYDAAAGTMVLNGTADAVGAAAGRVLFTAAGQPGAASSLVDITIEDGAGGVARDSSTVTIAGRASTAGPAFIGPPDTLTVIGGQAPAILAGSAGRDAYVLDGLTGPSAAALAGFGGGDSLIVWGFDPALVPWSWSDNDGPPSAAGRTLHVPVQGADERTVTFAGRSAVDTDGFVIAGGRFGGIGYLSVISPP